MASPTAAATSAPPPATPTATVTPASSGVAPRATPPGGDAAALASAPLLVYADEVDAEDDGSRHWPIVEVVTYDLRAKRLIAAFRVGKKGEFAYSGGFELAGRSVVMNLEKRVVVANLDGSNQREIFRVPDGSVITTVSVSPDGAVVAIGTEAEDLRDQSLAFLAFVDIKSGVEKTRIAEDVLTRAGLSGTPGPAHWLADGSAVEVYGIAHRDGVPQFKVTARPDGTVTPNVRTLLSLDPTGHYGNATTDTFVNACGELGFAQKALEITREPGGTVVGRIVLDGKAVTLWDWSPDGSEALVRAFPLGAQDGQPCFQFDGPAEWYAWSASGLAAVTNRDDVLARWHGVRLLQFVCTVKPVPPATGCGNAGAPRYTLMLGGKPLDEVRQGSLIGFVD